MPNVSTFVLAAALSVSACTTTHSKAGNHVQKAEISLGHDQRAPGAHEVLPPPLFEELARRVEAGRSVTPAVAQMPAWLTSMTYDAYRSIRFRPERSLWRGEPGQFEVQFFHPGFYFQQLVEVYVLDAKGLYPFPFSTQLFNYGKLERPATGAGLGFTGLRVHAPINRADYRDEILAVQGASYFRSLGRDQVYGLSARALALDMTSGRGEEFPSFVELYLVRPGPSDDAVWLLATVASKSARGVYAFHVTPGQHTCVDVFARLWVDDPSAQVGLAPLSSMFLFGEEAPGSLGDFRPEVHDSDGLAFVSRQGEWLYRPLRNPASTSLSVFRLDSPRGFGLLQRDRDAESYQDLEARYEARPSAWIEPLGDWGPGSVHLLEIASDEEINDNVALAWVPDAVPEGALSLRYRLWFGPGVPAQGRGPGGEAIATRMGRTKQGRRFVVDFRGRDVDPEADVTAQVDVRGARVLEQHVVGDPRGDRVRLSFEVAPDPGASDVDLRAFLRSGDDVVSETWSYRWQAPTP